MRRKGFFNKMIGTSFAAALVAAAWMGAVPVWAAEEDETEAESLIDEISPASDEDGEAQVHMSTDYPGLTVKSGETLSFSLDFASLDGAAHVVELYAGQLPEEWSGYFKGNSNQVNQVYVPGQTDDGAGEDLVTYTLTIPAEAEEGAYEVELYAEMENGSTDVLALQVNVSAEEVGESSFTSEYPEQQGATGSTFSFDTTIVNNRATDQTYSLSADLPDGWQISFVPSGESAAVTSLAVEAGSSAGMTVTITPPETVEKGDYAISCSAISANDTLKTDLSVSIIGTYSLTVSTPDGRLSFDAEANKQSSVTLTVTNSGNVDLTNINLSSSAPTDWEVSFSESSIDTLEAGATKEITAYVTPSEDAITGDYVTYLTASNDEATSEASFRVSVKTSTTWGIAALGIVIVLVLALGAIFKKYGRR